MENHEHGKLYDKVKVIKKDGVATFEGEITLSAIEYFKEQTLREVKKNFKHPGFRPGNVPEDIIRQNISEASLFEESAQDALKHAYPHLIHDHEVVPITYPRVEVKKFALGNPLEFKIEVGITPDFKLPNYISIGKDIPLEKAEITDEDVNTVIKDLEGARSTPEIPFTVNDENVSTIGKFENVADFKEKLKKHLVEEKQEATKMNRREIIGKTLIEKTKFELPTYWEEDERATIAGELEEHAERYKISKEEFLKGYKKSEAEFISEELVHRANAEKMKMILEKIANEKKLEATEEEIEREAIQLRNYYQETDYERLKQIAKTAIIRQKALELIEVSK